MATDTDRHLNCRQCGREFLFTKAEQEFYELKGFSTPSRCKECRSGQQSHQSPPVCTRCGAEIEKGASVCCANCLANVELGFEMKTKERQNATSAAHTKLLASERHKAELEEALRQKEKQVAELVLKAESLGEDLDKALQFQASLGTLQPTLSGIEERLKTLEYAHNKINERMLQIVQKIHEMHEKYENTSLAEIIKRSLRRYQGQGTGLE